MLNQNAQPKYTCPMHPRIVEDKMGTCPICGMTLVILNETESKSVDAQFHHDGSPLMENEGHRNWNLVTSYSISEDYNS